MIKEGTRVRHFKGMEYTVLAIAKHTETGEDLVIYKADYGEGQVYARPFSMFISQVDREQYSNVKQQYRFEEI